MVEYIREQTKEEKMHFILEEINFTLINMKKFSKSQHGDIAKGYNLAIYDMEDLWEKIQNRFKLYNISTNQEVIKKTVEVMRRGSMSKRKREVIFKKDGYRCKYCGCDDIDKLQVDHVIPISRGGNDEYKNLQTLCADCNRTKSNEIFD